MNTLELIIVGYLSLGILTSFVYAFMAGKYYFSLLLMVFIWPIFPVVALLEYLDGLEKNKK